MHYIYRVVDIFRQKTNSMQQLKVVGGEPEPTVEEMTQKFKVGGKDYSMAKHKSVTKF